jgi:O-antigen/teichoic acid export membrane protein
MLPPRRLANWIQRLRGDGVGAVLARGASAFLVVHVAGVGVGLGVQVLLARALGTLSYGTYVWVFSWMMLLLLLCRAGLATASLRFVPEFSARGDWPRLRGWLRTTRRVVLLSSLVVAGATALASVLLGDRLPDAARQTFLVGSLALPIYALLQLFAHQLRGFRRVLASQVPSTLLQPLLLGLAALCVLATGAGRLDAPAAMWLTAGSAGAALLWSAAKLRRALPPELGGAPPRSEPRAWLRVAAPLLLFNALFVIQERTDVLLVGSLLGAEQAGLYAAASRIANVILFGITAVNAWAAPLIADLHARQDRAGLQRLVRLAAQGIFVSTLPIALGVMIFGVEILSLFGPDFSRAHGVLVILAGSQIVSALVGPVGQIMTMTGRQVLAAWILGTHAVLMVGLNLLLIPRYGLEGAAFATGITRASWHLVMAVAVWRTLRLRVTIV